MPAALIELHGARGAAPLHCLPANGFPPQVYLPLLRAMPGYHAFSVAPRALWGNPSPPPGYDWHCAADDLLAGLVAADARDVVAIGHSLGAVVSLLALLQAPQRFRALVLLDPVFLPAGTLQQIAAAQARGNTEALPLVQGARRRRHRFASPAEARARFQQKPIFADWSAEALQLYIEYGLQPDGDGGVELVWSADWEAQIFATVPVDMWELIPRANSLAPLLVLHGQHSDSFPAREVARACQLLPAANFVEMPGQGHLFPMAVPARTAQIMHRWLADL